MLFGATHGVLLLPVLLSITDVCRGRTTSIDKKYKSNLSDQNNPPFFIGNKQFNGKAIMQNGAPIYIPRPSFTELQADPNNVKFPRADEDSGAGSKSSTSSDSSVVAEKDLGLGTSAEECSEGSWKGEKPQTHEAVICKQSDINQYKDQNVPNIYANMLRDWSQVSANTKSGPNGEHINSGYVSDSADFSGDYSIPLSTKHKKNNNKNFVPSTSQHRISVYHQISDIDGNYADRNQWERKSAPANKKSKGKDRSDNPFLVEVEQTHRRREDHSDRNHNRGREQRNLENDSDIFSTNLQVIPSRLDRNITNRYNGYHPR
jgi:hypothetical protein